MKNFHLLLFAVLAHALGAQSNEVPAGVRLTPPANVPAIVTERFRQEHPNVTASWQNAGDSLYLAAFTDDSTHLPARVLYSGLGERLQSHSLVQAGEYPAAIDSYLARKNEKLRFKVWMLKSKERTVAYYVPAGADSTWFDKEGRPLKSKTE